MNLPEGAVIQQIYPLTFADGNGDGVGDFPGIESRFDYLQQLGVDGIWTTPFFQSPFKDGGYDVSDYMKVDPRLGTQEQAVHMIQEARRRGLHVIADFVPSHASSMHPLFQQALQDPTDEHFIFTEDPNDWPSIFPKRTRDENGEIQMHLESAWRRVADRYPNAHQDRQKQYFLTSFAEYQPNWNHASPKVRAYLQSAIRYWLDAGISGFRIDAVPFLSQDEKRRNEPINEYYREGDPPNDRFQRRYSANGPRELEYLRELLSPLKDTPGAFAMLESYPERDQPDSDPIGHYMKYYDAFREAMPGTVAPFCFEITDLPWNARLFKQAIDSFQSRLKEGDVPIYPLGNHDKPRIASVLGQLRTRAITLLHHGLPGSIFDWQGNELGMTNHVGIPDSKLTDPWLGRDVTRSPVPMHARDPRVGFSTADPSQFILPIHPNYAAFNVETQLQDPLSMLNLYKRAIALRKNMEPLNRGTYVPVETEDPNVFAYARETEDDRCIVATNFGSKSTTVSIGQLGLRSRIQLSSRTVIRCPIGHSGKELKLRADEAMILRVPKDRTF